MISPEKSERGALTPTSFAILALVDQLGEASSYDLKVALENSVRHFWPIPHTTAYEEPARLALAGLLSSRQQPSGRRRRCYALTQPGKEALNRWVQEPLAAAPQLRDELWLKVFAGADPVTLLTQRIDFYRSHIAALEADLVTRRSSERGNGPEHALRAVLELNRMLLCTAEEICDVASPRG